MNAVREQITEDDFEKHLNNTYGEVDICLREMEAGTVLRKVDYVDFRERLDEKNREFWWKCGSCGAEFFNESVAEECCKE